MTPSQAADLATRISQTWPRGGVGPHVWEEDLLDLDPGRAGTTLVKLRRTMSQAPTIAAFREMYATVSITDGGTRTHDDCDQCGNTGNVPRSPGAPDGRELRDGVVACSCRWGDDIRDPLRLIAVRNAKELDRIMPARHQVAAAAPGTPAVPDPLF